MKLRFNTKEQLVTALEAVRPLAERLDKEAVAGHKVAEREFLDAWKRGLREALKWDYKTAVKESFRPNVEADYHRPSCPTPWVEKLDEALHFLGITHQQTFVLEDGYGTSGNMYRLLTLGAPSVKAVC